MEPEQADQKTAITSGIDVALSAYEQNRRRFTAEQLDNYRGKWVAFSPDGARIVASCENIADLDAAVRAAGEDPEEVGLERIEEDAVFLGGAELQ